MNKEIIKGHWRELKGKIRQQWGKITEDELDQLQGSYEELEGLLLKKYGYNKERVEKELEKMVKNENLH